MEQPDEWVERSRRLHGTTDAAVWAREWISIAGSKLAAGGTMPDLLDEGWMIGWFANAIEVGRSFGQGEECQDRPDYMPRPFVLLRHDDVTGVSGTGLVAAGVEFPDGVVALRWMTEWPTSVVFHDRGIDSVFHVHGHDGKTEVVWGW